MKIFILIYFPADMFLNNNLCTYDADDDDDERNEMNFHNLQQCGKEVFRIMLVIVIAMLHLNAVLCFYSFFSA